LQLFNGGIMKSISKKIADQSRLICLALLALTASHISLAQTVADATLSITGTVTATTCYLRINAAVGGTAATLALPQISVNATTKAAAAGASLSIPRQFSIGLSDGSNSSNSCGTTNTFNTVFYAPAAQVFTLGGANYIQNTAFAANTTGVAIGLFSLNSSNVVQAISSIPASPSSVTFAGASNTSSQTGLLATSVTSTQDFQLTIVKTVSAGTDIGPGAIAGTVMVSYAVF